VLDKAEIKNGGSFTKSQVEGVKLVARITPFLAVMVPFWGIYSQMSTAFQNQVKSKLFYYYFYFVICF
jgi:Na+-driven multidrug efflux pump